MRNRVNVCVAQCVAAQSELGCGHGCVAEGQKTAYVCGQVLIVLDFKDDLVLRIDEPGRQVGREQIRGVHTGTQFTVEGDAGVG